MHRSWMGASAWLVLTILLVLISSLLLVRSPDKVKATSGLEAAPLIPSDVHITINDVVASGFSNPVQVTHAGDGSGRLFVVEQTGRIRIIKNRAVLGTPFLNLSGLISCCGERGLLGLAFHPNYEVNGYFYVDYTRSSDGATVVARYKVSNGNPDLADPNSAMRMLTISQPYTNHNGGQLAFGPDGFLYVGTGDGGSAGDPQNNAQNINTLLGALLRLNVDGGAPYTIPIDNPYVGKPGLDELWAIGLRNPWRFSFDRGTGDLYIGDVGQNAWEEIDFQQAGTLGGRNFGWRCKEATHDYSFSGSCLTAQLTDPIAEYSHTVGHSVTGGFVYRGSLYQALVGRYFYADYVDGKIWSLYKTGTNPTTFSTPELELSTGLNLSAFGEDEDGELYVVNYGEGKIHRLADVNGPSPNLSSSTKQVSTPSADPSEVVRYTISLTNTGSLLDAPVYVTDTLPAGLDYVPGSLQASHGTWDDTLAPTLSWQGNLNASLHITITYQVTVTGNVTGSLVNQAIVSAPPAAPQALAESLSVPSSVLTTTIQDFFFPGTQPGHLNVETPPGVDCNICHSEPIYDRWRGSMMSQAGRDPLAWAALHIANIDAPGAGEYCLRCHTAKGWLQGRSHPSDGSALSPADISNGVTCALCHRLVDPRPSTLDEAAAIDQSIRATLSNPVPIDFIGSGAIIVDPNDRRRGPFSFALALAYHSAYQTDFLGQASDAVARSRMCGTCHNVFNPVLSWDPIRGQFWPNSMDTPAPEFSNTSLFPVETTYDEWLYSDFANGGVYAPQFAGEKPDGIVSACQDCHMRRITGAAADAAFNPVLRNCQTTGCLPEHTFVGGNVWVPGLLQDPDWRLNAQSEAGYLDYTAYQAATMLRLSASMSVTLTNAASNKLATVRVTNLTGHKLPTGYPEGRQMWLNLQAFDANDQLIYKSGAYDPLSGQLTRDAAAKIYEVKQGITPELAALLPQFAGESFHFVLNNTVIKDNRIPPQGYTQAAYDRPGLRPVGATYVDGQNWDETLYILPLETERVMATLYYQTASREYIDFLHANGGIDGLSLKRLWDKSKSPPQIMAQAWFPSYDVYLPLIEKNNQYVAGVKTSSVVGLVKSNFGLLVLALSAVGVGLKRLLRRSA
jgi:uncharacterized repeat protein (TIGR01451 family)